MTPHSETSGFRETLRTNEANFSGRKLPGSGGEMREGKSMTERGFRDVSTDCSV